MVEDYTETGISCLGEFEHVPVYVFHYVTYHTPIVATWKKVELMAS